MKHPKVFRISFEHNGEGPQVTKEIQASMKYARQIMEEHSSWEVAGEVTTLEEALEKGGWLVLEHGTGRMDKEGWEITEYVFFKPIH